VSGGEVDELEEIETRRTRTGGRRPRGGRDSIPHDTDDSFDLSSAGQEKLEIEPRAN